MLTVIEDSEPLHGGQSAPFVPKKETLLDQNIAIHEKVPREPLYPESIIMLMIKDAKESCSELGARGGGDIRGPNNGSKDRP